MQSLDLDTSILPNQAKPAPAAAPAATNGTPAAAAPTPGAAPAPHAFGAAPMNAFGQQQSQPGATAASPFASPFPGATAEAPPQARAMPSTAIPAYQHGAVQAPMPSNSYPGAPPMAGGAGVPPPPMAAGYANSHPPTNSGTSTPPRLDTTPKMGSPASAGSTPSNNALASLNSSGSPNSPSRRRNSFTKSGNNQQSSRIDPEQVPRPVGQPEAAREEGGKVYETNKYHVPPPANAVCTIVDKGSSSCEFIRSTVNQMPAYPSTANTTHVPMGIIVQPFAELTSFEEPVPLIDFGEPGPLRCTRCRSYINPYFTWVNNGQEAICNFCNQRMEVGGRYFCALDEHGQRRDQSERPELCKGTVDYVAPSDYSDVLPGVPGIFFVVDASHTSIQCGFFQQVMWTLRSLLPYIPEKQKIGIATFDSVMHFYAFYPGREASQIMMADIEEPFAPCSPHSLLVDVSDDEMRAQFEALLDSMPEMFANSRNEQSVGCGALKAGVDLLVQHGGGHVLMFHSMIPNSGAGALRNRDDIKCYNTPEGVSLYGPQQGPLLDEISGDCLSGGVAVSVFLAPPMGQYIDVASLSLVPRRTGGETHYLPAFNPSRDGERLHFLISRSATAGGGFSCIFKLRCGKGLQVDNMFASWEPEVIDQSTFQVSRLTPDHTACFLLTHTERIEGQKHAYLQAACLYTDRQARRLIRVCTLKLPVTSSLSNVFRYTEIDAVTNTLVKQAANAAIRGDMTFKDKLTKACVDMLHAYRSNCASTTAAGQLILPESLKLLPLYIGALRKMPAFRSGSDVRMDERIAGLCKLLSLGVGSSSLLIYPRVYPVWPLNERVGKVTGVSDNVYLPHTIASSHERLPKDGMYLFDNGVFLILYLCADVHPEVLQEVFYVGSLQEVPYAFHQAQQPEASTSEALQRILAIVKQIRKDNFRLPWTPLSVVIPNTVEEGKLLALFPEDRMAGEMPYVDFLCHIHKLVQNKAVS